MNTIATLITPDNPENNEMFRYHIEALCSAKSLPGIQKKWNQISLIYPNGTVLQNWFFITQTFQRISLYDYISTVILENPLFFPLSGKELDPQKTILLFIKELINNHNKSVKKTKDSITLIINWEPVTDQIIVHTNTALTAAPEVSAALIQPKPTGSLRPQLEATISYPKIQSLIEHINVSKFPLKIDYATGKVTRGSAKTLSSPNSYKIDGIMYKNIQELIGVYIKLLEYENRDSQSQVLLSNYLKSEDNQNLYKEFIKSLLRYYQIKSARLISYIFDPRIDDPIPGRMPSMDEVNVDPFKKKTRLFVWKKYRTYSRADNPKWSINIEELKKMGVWELSKKVLKVLKLIYILINQERSLIPWEDAEKVSDFFLWRNKSGMLTQEIVMDQNDKRSLEVVQYREPITEDELREILDKVEDFEIKIHEFGLTFSHTGWSLHLKIQNIYSMKKEYQIIKGLFENYFVWQPNTLRQNLVLRW